jgi:membrane-associated phospholipid phosphatase
MFSIERCVPVRWRPRPAPRLGTGSVSVSLTVAALATTAILPVAIPASASAQESAAEAGGWQGADQDSLPSTLDRLQGVGTDLLSDTWSVLKAPAGWGRDDAELLSAVFGVGAALFFFDEEIDRMVQDGRDRRGPSALEEVGEFLEPLGNVGAPTVAMTVGWAVSGALGQDGISLVLQEIVTAQLISTVTRHVARHVIGRSRPRDGVGAYTFQFGEGTSFPSGHAATITQLAWILSRHVDNPWIEGAMWAGAGSVMYQRLTSGAHWASDIWFGAFWGWGIAKVVVEAREADWIEVAPSLDPHGAGLGVQARIWF